MILPPLNLSSQSNFDDVIFINVFLSFHIRNSPVSLLFRNFKKSCECCLFTVKGQELCYVGLEINLRGV